MGEWACESGRAAWNVIVWTEGLVDDFALVLFTEREASPMRVPGSRWVQDAPGVSTIVICLVAKQLAGLFSAHANVLPSRRSQYGPQERFGR